MTTLKQLHDQLEARFGAAGTKYPEEQAAILIRELRHLQSSLSSLDLPLDEAVVAQAKALSERAINQRIPIALLLGKTWFADLTLVVEPGVIIPDSVSMNLVQCVISRLRELGDDTIWIAEVGTGSGAISLAVASQMSQTRIIAGDINPNAVSLARRNAESNGLDNQVEVVESDVLAGFPEGQLFHAIIANPPYMPRSRERDLPPEVLEHSPDTALFGGEDGMEIVRRVIEQAMHRLLPSGILAIEYGDDIRLPLRQSLDNIKAFEYVEDVQLSDRDWGSVMLARLAHG